jgi:hypothetical protein
VIRQAISCDICGADKQQTNHWFIAFDQGAELRISGLNARNRLRPGARHLCGQTCLHKLVDEFMARTIAMRMPSAQPDSQSPAKRPPRAASAAGVSTQQPIATAPSDTSLTSAAAHAVPSRSALAARNLDEYESSATLLTQVPVRAPALARPSSTAQPVIAPPLPPPAPNPRLLHAEAWKREREREQREASTQHRRSIA